MQWRKNGKRIRDDGKFIRCNECPCCKVLVVYGYWENNAPTGPVGYVGLYGNRPSFGLADPQAAFPAAKVYNLTSGSSAFDPPTIPPPVAMGGSEGYRAYDVVIMILPFDPNQLGDPWKQAALTAWFKLGGKRLVLVGEWHAAWNAYNTVANNIATAVGSAMSMASNSLDATDGFVNTTAHPLTTGNGITEIDISLTGSVSGGTPLMVPTPIHSYISMSWESIVVPGGKSEIILSGDSSCFGALGLNARTYDNTDFFQGLCSVPVAQ